MEAKFVLVRGTSFDGPIQTYGPFRSQDDAAEYDFDRFGGGGRVVRLRPLDVLHETMPYPPLPVDAAIAELMVIEKRCPDVAVKVLTLGDVLDFDTDEAEATGVALKPEDIRATSGWQMWHEHNDLDGEEIAQIAYDARNSIFLGKKA